MQQRWTVSSRTDSHGRLCLAGAHDGASPGPSMRTDTPVPAGSLTKGNTAPRVLQLVKSGDIVEEKPLRPRSATTVRESWDAS